MKEKKKKSTYTLTNRDRTGLYSSRPFSKNRDFSGSRGQGSQWGDILVGRRLLGLEMRWGALGRDVGC